jgi:hypothetical protein
VVEVSCFFEVHGIVSGDSRRMAHVEDAIPSLW